MSLDYREPDFQIKFFTGAAKAGNLPSALWEVLSHPSLCISGNHEKWAKEAIQIALNAQSSAQAREMGGE